MKVSKLVVTFFTVQSVLATPINESAEEIDISSSLESFSSDFILKCPRISYYCLPKGQIFLYQDGFDPDSLNLKRGFKLKYYNMPWGSDSVINDNDVWTNYRNTDFDSSKPFQNVFEQRGLLDINFNNKGSGEEPVWSTRPFGHLNTETNFTYEFTALLYNWGAKYVRFSLKSSNGQAKMAIGKPAFECANHEVYIPEYPVHSGWWGSRKYKIPRYSYTPIRIVVIATHGNVDFLLSISPCLGGRNHPIEQWIIDPDVFNEITPTTTTTICEATCTGSVTTTQGASVIVTQQPISTIKSYAIVDSTETKVGTDCIATVILPPTRTITSESAGYTGTTTTVNSSGDEIIIIPITSSSSSISTTTWWSLHYSSTTTIDGADGVQTIIKGPTSTTTFTQIDLPPTTYVQPDGVEVVVEQKKGGNVGSNKNGFQPINSF